jgi:hypothetical protein
MLNQFPKGWNEERVRELLAHYEEQTDEAAAAEAEEALAHSTDTVMTVPHELGHSEKITMPACTNIPAFRE